MKEKQKSIVLVEDHTILRHGLRSLLTTAANVKIVGEAGDGQSAIRCILDHQPDLVLLDLNMPKMDGFSVVTEVKKQQPETKILALTMHDDDAYVLKAFEAGADAVLVLACPEERCRYAEGGKRAKKRIQYTRGILDQIGMDGEKQLAIYNTDSGDKKAVMDIIKRTLDGLKDLKAVPSE